MSNAAPSPTPPKRRLPRLRFSLRTLVIGVLLVASAGGLWYRWEPWVLERTLSHPDLHTATITHDGSHLATGSVNGTIRVWDANTGSLIRELNGHRIAAPENSSLL